MSPSTLLRMIGAIAVVVLCGAWDPVTRKVREVEEGNRRYAAGEYAEAEKRYREAEKRLPGTAGVHFDLGAALHKQALAAEGPQREQLFDAAEKELRLALDATDAKLRSSAHYNLGNTLYERGKFEEAIGEYKKSLRLDPSRDDARHNLELALRMIQQPPPQPQPQPKQDEEKKPSQEQEQQAQTPPQQGEQPKQDEPKPQPQPGPEEDEKPQQQQQGAQAEPKDLSQEDIERKLKELERRSKDLQVQKAAERSQERRRGKPAKDW